MVKQCVKVFGLFLLEKHVAKVIQYTCADDSLLDRNSRAFVTLLLSRTLHVAT